MSWPLPPNEQTVLELAAKSECPFMWRGGGPLFVAQAGAQDVIREASSRGLTVIGLDGYLLSDGMVEPQLSLIYDSERSSSDVDPGGLVASWPSSAWVEITLADSAHR